MARSSLGFKPLRECNWTVKRRAGETPAFPPIKPVSRRIRQGAPDFSVADRTQEWVAGDAVLIQTSLWADSLQTGNFTGKFAISGLPIVLLKAEVTMLQRLLGKSLLD
jgi:hypothetical protein